MHTTRKDSKFHEIKRENYNFIVNVGRNGELLPLSRRDKTGIYWGHTCGVLLGAGVPPFTGERGK